MWTVYCSSWFAKVFVKFWIIKYLWRGYIWIRQLEISIVEWIWYDHVQYSMKYSIIIPIKCHWFDQYTRTHFDMISGLCWKHSCIWWYTFPVWARWRNIASCSSADMCFVSWRFAYICNLWTSFKNAKFDIPKLLWNQDGCPASSSWGHASPLSIKSCIVILVIWEAIYEVTAPLAMAPTRVTTFLWALCRASAAFWMNSVWLLSIWPMVVRKHWYYQDYCYITNLITHCHNCDIVWHNPWICATGFLACFRKLQPGCSFDNHAACYV